MEQNAQLKGKPTEGEWFPSAHAAVRLCKWGPCPVSLPGASAPSGVELWSGTAVTHCGVPAPPGGVFWECQAQAGGPLDSTLSPAVLYQYEHPRGDERA